MDAAQSRILIKVIANVSYKSCQQPDTDYCSQLHAFVTFHADFRILSYNTEISFRPVKKVEDRKM